MLESIASHSLTLLECILSHSALLLELILVLAALHHVARPQLDRVHQPLEELGQGDRVLLDLLGGLLVAAEQLLQETQLLVELELTVLGAEGMVLRQALEELSTVLRGSEEDEAGLFPFEFVSVTLADLLAGVAEQVEHGLEHARHLHHCVLCKRQYCLLPLICRERLVGGGTLSLVGLAMLAELRLGILGLDVIERLGEESVARLLLGGSLGVLVNGLLALLGHD